MHPGNSAGLPILRASLDLVEEWQRTAAPWDRDKVYLALFQITDGTWRRDWPLHHQDVTDPRVTVLWWSSLNGEDNALAWRMAENVGEPAVLIVHIGRPRAQDRDAYPG